MSELKEYKLKYKPSDIVIYANNKDTATHESSMIAVSKSTNKVMAVGNEAKTILETEEVPDDVVIFSPLRPWIYSRVFICCSYVQILSIQGFWQIFQKTKGDCVYTA